MTNWKLGQFCRVWKNEGYEYGHIETMDSVYYTPNGDFVGEVMLVGDDGREIYARVKDLEEGE